MKIKSYILFLVSALALGLSSCSNYLDEDNKTGMTGSLTYSTKAGIDGLMASCYSFSRGWYGKEPSLGLSEMGADLFCYGYDNKQKSLNSYSITSVSLDDDVNDNACLDQYWEMFYDAVDACNNALQYVPLNNVISATKKQQYLAEAYFLRAFYYWHMVNIWGPIPYNTEPPMTINTNPTRVPEEVVYSNMLTDLDKSIALFDTTGYKIKTEGRANYWSARALKSRVLLYAASWLGRTSITTNAEYSGQDLYSLAQAEADAVINSGTASFYTNYSDTWSMTNESVTKNNEAIFGVTYANDLLTPVNCIPYRYRTDDKGNLRQYNSLITRTGYTRGGSAMLLMFVSKWNNGCKDLGGDGKQIFMRALSTTADTIRNSKTKVLVHVAPYYSPYGRGFTRYLPSVYLWNLLDKHRATDQRTNATLLEAYTIAPGLEGNAKNYPSITDTAIYYCPLDGNSPEGIAKQEWAKNRYRIQFMYNGDIPVYTSGDPATAIPTSTAKVTSDVYGDARYNDINIGGWCSYPGIKKFLDNVYDPTYPTNDISYRDAIVLRLAEMYLIKAECQLYTESGASAMTTINQLRAIRAISGQDNSLSGDANIETILEERAVELCGEQQRWFDLKRTKTLVAHVKAYNAQASKNIQDYHLLRPIPQTQLDAVTNESDVQGTGFWQNPGY
jgi:hypothetical protein